MGNLEDKDTFTIRELYESVKDEDPIILPPHMTLPAEAIYIPVTTEGEDWPHKPTKHLLNKDTVGFNKAFYTFKAVHLIKLRQEFIKLSKEEQTKEWLYEQIQKKANTTDERYLFYMNVLLFEEITNPSEKIAA